jgi:hypothetical protein
MYGDVDGQIEFPSTPDEWATQRWLNFTLRIDPKTPWLKPRIRHQIDNFEVVVAARWPTVQDIHMPAWSRRALQALSSWRYLSGFYAAPVELRWAQRFLEMRKPKFESV